MFILERPGCRWVHSGVPSGSFGFVGFMRHAVSVVSIIRLNLGVPLGGLVRLGSLGRALAVVGFIRVLVSFDRPLGFN